MRKQCILIAAVLLICTLPFGFLACDKPGETEKIEEVKPIFFDDFDTLDTSVWNVYSATTADYQGFGPADGMRKGGYWDKDQVFTENGNLVIRTEYKDGKYYTGAIDTDGKFDRHFGYYEAKVYLPEACGLWAAFWIMCNQMGHHPGTTDAKVTGAEIDIFESPYYSPFDPDDPEASDAYQTAVHMGNYDGNDPDSCFSTAWLSSLMYDEPLSIYGDWHVFALDWQQDYYRFYLDGKLMNEFTLKGNISNIDSFLFLSVEIGGSGGNAGTPPFVGTKSITTNAADAIPADFLVDYVKVWEKKPTA